MTVTERTVPVRAMTHGPKHHFVGFHDLCPWNAENRFLLAHEVGFVDRMPAPEDRATVGYIDLANGNRFVPVGETTAWNFQQGARLQWLPGDKDRLLFNVRTAGGLAANIVECNTGAVRTIPNPVYAVHPSGAWGISLNFGRLERLGGYGYAGAADAYAADPAPAGDGLFRIDFASGTRTLLLSIAAVAAVGHSRDTDPASNHYLTHPVFSPDGSRFCFLHRFFLRDGGLYTRLFTANADGSGLVLAAEGTLTHFTWFENDYIVIWGRSRPALTALRRNPFFSSPLFRPLLALLRRQRGAIRHRLIGDQFISVGARTGARTPFAVGTLTEDGHPMWLPGTSWFVCDTYASAAHRRALMLFDEARSARFDLGTFASLPAAATIAAYRDAEPWDQSGMRSDLHPRWRLDGGAVCFDSVHEGTRQVYLAETAALVKLGAA